jgi:hypothetical protein
MALEAGTAQLCRPAAGLGAHCSNSPRTDSLEVAQIGQMAPFRGANICFYQQRPLNLRKSIGSGNLNTRQYYELMPSLNCGITVIEQHLRIEAGA